MKTSVTFIVASLLSLPVVAVPLLYGSIFAAEIWFRDTPDCLRQSYILLQATFELWPGAVLPLLGMAAAAVALAWFKSAHTEFERRCLQVYSACLTACFFYVAIAQFAGKALAP